MSNTIKAYDDVAVEFANDTFKWTPFDLIDEFSNLLKPNSSILDVGCGSGRDAKVFFTKGYVVTGIDASEKLVSYAKNKFPEISFSQGYMQELMFPDKHFDGIWCHAVLLHLEKDSEVVATIKEFWRVLRPRGIVHVYVKAYTSGPEKEEVTGYFFKQPRLFRYFKLDILKEVINNCGFKIIKAIQTEESTIRINGRPGVYWIQILARK